MAKLERPDRLQVMLGPEELEALDTWRFEKRMPSRAAAVRELLRRGLAAEGFLSAAQNSRSGGFRHPEGQFQIRQRRRVGIGLRARPKCRLTRQRLCDAESLRFPGNR